MKRIVLIVLTTLVLLSFAITAFAVTNSEYEKAINYYNTGKYSEAVSLLKEYVEKNPAPDAYYRIGYGLYKLKKFDEANEYFKEAFFIDPSYSTGITVVPEKYPKAEMAPKPAGATESVQQRPSVTEAKTEQPVTAEAKPAEPVQQAAPEVVPQEQAAAPEPQAVETSEQAPIPQAVPSFPEMQKMEPEKMQGPVAAMVAGFLMVFVIIGIVLYVYYSLCFYRIAKKLNVPAAWVAWIPVIQIWILVPSAGKPGWWILLLLFVPFVYVYLWMCIIENLGKNKWLGLLMMLPPIDMILLGILAFSKTGENTKAVAQA